MKYTERQKERQHKKLSKGDKVKVKGFYGDTFEGLVWKVLDNLVLICSERQFEWLEEGDVRAAPIGFRMSELI